MSYPRGATWRDYPVVLTYPSGRRVDTSVRAISRRDASYRANRRWGGIAEINLLDTDGKSL